LKKKEKKKTSKEEPFQNGTSLESRGEEGADRKRKKKRGISYGTGGLLLETGSPVLKEMRSLGSRGEKSRAQKPEKRQRGAPKRRGPPHQRSPKVRLKNGEKLPSRRKRKKNLRGAERKGPRVTEIRKKKNCQKGG